jgi:hypothetical protein
MNLREFVRDALVEISLGVVEANDALVAYRDADRPSYILESSGEPAERLVQFDVAVTSTATEGGSGGGGLQVAGILQLGAKGEASSSEQQVSRIKFSVVRNMKLYRKVAP